MKKFLKNLLPKIHDYSKKLDDESLLLNKSWVQVNDIRKSKLVFVFKSGNKFILSENGVAKIGNWDYIDSKSILIGVNGENYVYNHGFIDNEVLALKLDSKSDVVFFINQSISNILINSEEDVMKFLVEKSKSLPISNYQSIKVSEKRLLSLGKLEKHKINFRDFEGFIYYNTRNNKTYFEDSIGFTSKLHRIYNSKNSCINALYVFLKEKRISQKGYLETKQV